MRYVAALLGPTEVCFACYYPRVHTRKRRRHRHRASRIFELPLFVCKSRTHSQSHASNIRARLGPGRKVRRAAGSKRQLGRPRHAAASVCIRSILVLSGKGFWHNMRSLA